MFDYLLDNLNRAVGDPRRAKWHRVVELFRLKYPDVDICKYQLWADGNPHNERVPVGFLVWRIGLTTPDDLGLLRQGWREGQYVVQLLPAWGVTVERQLARLNTLERGLFAPEAKYVKDRTVITGWGKFGYDGDIGELTPSFGHRNFCTLVLKEDGQRYNDMGRQMNRSNANHFN